LARKLALMKIPGDIREIWGPAPLLRHEDPETYERLARQISHDVAPTDVIDWLAVKDVLDLTWEIRRLRRFKAMLIELKREDKMADETEDAEEDQDADEDQDVDEDQYADETEDAGDAQDMGETQDVDKTEDADEAQDANQGQDETQRLEEMRRYYETEQGETKLFLENLDHWERIDNLIAAAEMRRAAALHGIERRRPGVADRLRQASNNIIEGECEEPAQA
jgi:cobalamin biosynthesis protein CobT